MSWAEIKKAINSNLAKPLDKLIEEKTVNIRSDVSKVKEVVDRLYVHDGDFTLFTVDGTYTVLNGVTKIYVSAIGGGGGGGGNYEYYPRYYCGGGGDAGNYIKDVLYEVTPGDTINITIGQGGNGGASKSSGKTGGGTIIGELVTISGGNGGYGNSGSGNLNTYVPGSAQEAVFNGNYGHGGTGGLYGAGSPGTNGAVLICFGKYKHDDIFPTTTT